MQYRDKSINSYTVQYSLWQENLLETVPWMCARMGVGLCFYFSKFYCLCFIMQQVQDTVWYGSINN